MVNCKFLYKIKVVGKLLHYNNKVMHPMTHIGLYFLKTQTYLSKWTGSAMIRRLCISSSLIGAQSIAMVPKMYVVRLGISKAPCSASCFINSMSSASSIWLFKRVCRGRSKDSRVYKPEWRTETNTL